MNLRTKIILYLVLLHVVLAAVAFFVLAENRKWLLIVEGLFLISIAVAGFKETELEIIAEDNQLLVRGKQKDEGQREFLHRGIAARQFQRSFLLADGVEIGEATLRHGMLTIAVVRPKASRLARRIEIRSA